MYMVRLTKKVEFSLKNAQKLEFSGNPDEVGNPEKKFYSGMDSVVQTVIGCPSRVEPSEKSGGGAFGQKILHLDPKNTNFRVLLHFCPTLKKSGGGICPPPHLRLWCSSHVSNVKLENLLQQNQHTSRSQGERTDDLHK